MGFQLARNHHPSKTPFMPNMPPTENQSPNSSLPGLLQGVRVLDLTHYISGPYCTKLMATMGAEVIKVERRGTGDPIRQFGPFAKTRPSDKTGWSAERLKLESGAWFLYLNTSKKSLTLDLKSTEGRAILECLATSSHIMVENFAPGAMDRLNLGPSHLLQSNPALVITSISNYGQTGPHRDWKAAEINLYAAASPLAATSGLLQPRPSLAGPRRNEASRRSAVQRCFLRWCPETLPSSSSSPAIS